MRNVRAGALGASIHSLQKARYFDRQKKAEILEEFLSEILPPATASEIALLFAAKGGPNPDTSERWVFAMINPVQNFAVQEWLGKNSTRPQVAARLWALLLTALRPDTGEILLTRSQISDRLGVEPKNVSTLMTELSRINAIRREKDGRAVRYFLNPMIATHIPSPEARKAARTAAGPLLVLMDGGRPEK